MMSSKKNRTSSVVTRSPSDHFMPRRRVKVQEVPSSLIDQSSYTPGRVSTPTRLAWWTLGLGSISTSSALAVWRMIGSQVGSRLVVLSVPP